MVRIEERRRHVRYPFERHLEVRGPDPASWMVVRANDISQGGFSFFSDSPLLIGDHITLGLRADEEFLVEATVRNVRREGEFYVVGAERLET
jgi:hypothetical protein